MNQALLAGIIKPIDDIPMKSAPIEPTWVLAGQPVARVGAHSKNIDGWASTNIWDCTAGRFRWHFVWEETVAILEGEVRVTNEAGETFVLKAGSIGYFPGGTWWTWEVPNYVRKIAFCRALVPRWARGVTRLKEAVVDKTRRALTAIPGVAGVPVASVRMAMVAIAASAGLAGVAIELL
jgi:uncharacterized cupin superfamily protein